jgi:hypothetical protein
MVFAQVCFNAIFQLILENWSFSPCTESVRGGIFVFVTAAKAMQMYLSFSVGDRERPVPFARAWCLGSDEFLPFVITALEFARQEPDLNINCLSPAGSAFFLHGEYPERE